MQNKEKLFDSDQTNNLSQNKLISIIDSTLFSNRTYLISKIQEVLRYSSDKGIIIKLEDHEGKEISVQELVDRYYKDPEKYFELDSKRNNNSTTGDSSSGHSPFTRTTDEGKSKIEIEQLEDEPKSSFSSTSELPVQGSKEEQENNFVKERVSDEYLENAENASKLQEMSRDNSKSVESQQNLSNKLFDSEKTNNLIYSDEVDDQDKEHQLRSIPSTMISSIDQISPTPLRQHQEQERQQYKKFNCFYCDQAYSSDKERVKHIDYQHQGKLYYPTPEDFEKRLL
jgi:hypothetical protein